MTRVLVVNSYDSFIYNIVQILEQSTLCSYQVEMCDRIDYSALSCYDSIILSPGPSTPMQNKHLGNIINSCKNSHKILGVCLGHQAIAHYFGVELMQMDRPMHGHPSQLHNICTTDPIVGGQKEGAIVGRYHSWLVDSQSLEACPHLKPTSYDEQGNIMSLAHTLLPIYGVQFHPESIITQNGKEMIENFLRL